MLESHRIRPLLRLIRPDISTRGACRMAIDVLQDVLDTIRRHGLITGIHTFTTPWGDTPPHQTARISPSWSWFREAAFLKSRKEIRPFAPSRAAISSCCLGELAIFFVTRCIHPSCSSLSYSRSRHRGRVLLARRHASPAGATGL